MPLPEGAYEHLVTTSLAEAIGETRALTPQIVALDDADSPIVLARHVGREIQRALASLPAEGRAERAREMIEKFLADLARYVSADVAEAIHGEQLDPPARKLLALSRGAPPERPRTPLSTSTLLTRNRAESSLGHELAREIAIADRIDAIIAFVTVGGVRAIIESLERFTLRPGSKLRLLTTTFTGTTEIAALDRLAGLPNAEVRISYDTRRSRLHAKAWMFHRDTGLTTAYVGSANLTATALGAGQEWMVKIGADLPHVIEQFAGTFETLWAEPEFEHYLPGNNEHRARLAAALRVEKQDDVDRFLVTLQLYPFQQEILDKLAVERAVHGRKRNLVVAATGTGKTVIAAFDYQRQMTGSVRPRLLFLAHREELLEQARRTFRFVLQDAAFGELLVGGAEPARWDHVFATVQSALSRGLLERWGGAHFRHVIIDECHHIPASSYRQLISGLEPDLLVGLTATPERTDGKSLLTDFGGHIGAELRLWHALDDQLLVPFEYYGIADATDLRRVRWTRSGYDVAELTNLYTADHARADLVRHQLARRVSDVREVCALGFCVSIDHAKVMAERFSRAGIPSIALHGDSDPALRADAPRQLRDREINVIFTCDLYNEGVDLPFVDTLILLRPTQSSTVFLQQLGRGLRHFRGPPSKTSCLVLDFIGQHHEKFRFDGILCALSGVPRARIERDVKEGFPFLPAGCSMNLDAVARETILRSLKSSIGGAQKIIADIRELGADRSTLRLAEFLEQTGRDLEEIYATDLGWTTLQHRAGVIDGASLSADTDDLSRRLGWLLHIDEPERLRGYRDAVAHPSRSLSALDRGRLHMLDAQLENRGIMRAAEDTARYLADRPAIARELDELREVLEDRVTVLDQTLPVAEWPLALHRHYTRREIVAAVGLVTPGEKLMTPQAGVLKVKDEKRELLFVTLDKSGRGFSPTTRYKDYAISRDLFHWETQAAASVSRPSGKRYIESATNEWQFYLFVRTAPEERAFAFLGPVRYQSHQGDRPVAITWRLEAPMTAALYDRYATLRPR